MSQTEKYAGVITAFVYFFAVGIGRFLPFMIQSAGVKT